MATTLLIRNLPEAIPVDMLARIFSNYGASAVRPCVGGKLRNCAFVNFEDEIVATQAQTYFNRLNFLGKVLRVERARKKDSNNSDSHSQNQSGRMSSTSASAIPLSETSTNLKKSASAGEPIAPRLGVEYPFTPHLEYAYPPPDGSILTNILNALIAVPHFYAQVLHLMNKMNIPAPFHAALPTPPLPPPAPASLPPPHPVMKQTHLTDLSSDESEMESSEEDAGVFPAKKRIKREAIVGPAVGRSVSHEAVGVKPVPLLPKELPVIRKKNPVLQIKIAPKTTSKEAADDDNDIKEPDLGRENLDQSIFATPQEIESGKLPLEEILSLPMFKNYSPGNPASGLYIKNLAKDVVDDDFYFIFGSLFGSNDAAKASLNIKLMKVGLLRGQAFVRFPSVDLAQHALNLANGYIFKGKPMIIHFSRSRASVEAT